MLKEGEYLSIDGSTGEIYAGMIETADQKCNAFLKADLRQKRVRPSDFIKQ